MSLPSPLTSLIASTPLLVELLGRVLPSTALLASTARRDLGDRALIPTTADRQPLRTVDVASTPSRTRLAARPSPTRRSSSPEFLRVPVPDSFRVSQFQAVRVCPSSRQFSPPSTSSPSRIRHSRTELIANQVPMLPMSNHISSRSLDVVDEVVGRSRRCAGGHLFPSAAGRPSTASTNGGRVLSPFDELGEPSPTSLSRSSTSRGDSGGSPAPLYDGWSGQSNTETTAAAAADLPPTVTLHVSASTRADLVDIRSMLAAYMKRLADKDATASVTKEWRIVAKVFDRLFFFLYCATIIVSLLTIFPRS